ncbi:MAG TPA: hypothetical protein VFQ40_07420 [Actinomycetota bacterium]|nr:hypothetical protein [Actinomycetota bacterium]
MSQQPTGSGLGLRPGADHEDPDESNVDQSLLAQFMEDEGADEDQVDDQGGALEDRSIAPADEEEEPSGFPGAPGPPEPAPAAQVPEEELVEPGTTREEIAEAAQQLAGGYDTVEQLSEGYVSLQGAFTRVSQDYRAQQAYLEAQEQQLADTQDQLDELIEMLQNREAENDPEFAERLERSRQLREEIDARITPIEEHLEQQAQAQPQLNGDQQAAVAAITAFQQRHPDVPPRSPADMAFAQVFRELRASGVPLDIRSGDHLEIAYEALQNPNLKMELMMSPNALNVQGGLDVLRQRAGATVAATGGTPQPGTRPPAQGATRRRPSAHVETGTGGAPADTAPGKQPDEFDEAMSWYSEEFTKGPLYGSGR